MAHTYNPNIQEAEKGSELEVSQEKKKKRERESRPINNFLSGNAEF